MTATKSALTAPIKDDEFTISFEIDGEITGSLDGFELADDVKVVLDGRVELEELASKLVKKTVIRNDKSKYKAVWIKRIDVRGNKLVLNGGGRYEDRIPLPFGGWTKVFSQSGNIELHLEASAAMGKPVVKVTHVDVSLGGLLGDLMEVFNIDDVVSFHAKKIIQKEVSRQVNNAVPSEIGAISQIELDDIAFTSMDKGVGVVVSASATIDLA